MGCGASKSTETERPPGKEEPVRDRRDQPEVRQVASDFTLEAPVRPPSADSNKSENRADLSPGKKGSALSAANPLFRQQSLQNQGAEDTEKPASAAASKQDHEDAASTAEDNQRRNSRSVSENESQNDEKSDIPAATGDEGIRERYGGGYDPHNDNSNNNDDDNNSSNNNNNYNNIQEGEATAAANIASLQAVHSAVDHDSTENRSSHTVEQAVDGDENMQQDGKRQEKPMEENSSTDIGPSSTTQPDLTEETKAAQLETNEQENTEDKVQSDFRRETESECMTERVDEASSSRENDHKTPDTISTLTAAQEMRSETPVESNKKRAKERKKKRKKEAVSKMAAPGKMNEEVRKRLVQGDLEIACPPTAKVVRVFLSSPFTDSRGERNLILKETFAKLRARCRELGYEFQLVDMRWGVEQTVTDLHQTTALCLHEIKQCMRISTGPCFLAMLSHRYGGFSCPDSIPQEDMEEILQHLGQDDVEFLVGHRPQQSEEIGTSGGNLGWFVLDTNREPAEYVLRPSNDKYPDAESKKNYWKDEAKIISLIREATRKMKGEKEADRCIRGVTELEIEEGLLNHPRVKEACLWLHRNVVDIEDYKDEKSFTRFMDTLTEEDSPLKMELMKELKSKMAKELKGEPPDDNVFPYDVKWAILTQMKSKEDIPEEEMERLAEKGGWLPWLEHRLWTLIDRAVQERLANEVKDNLLVELMQHATLSQTTLKDFCGRISILETIEKYVRGDEKDEDKSDEEDEERLKYHKPLLLHGVSGCGKTAVIAKAAREARKWLGGKGVIITRFVGTTPDSSRVSTVLHNFTEQILTSLEEGNRRENAEEKDTKDFNQISEDLNGALRKATKDNPVVIFLDSFDQLDPLEEAMNISWIPKKLPKNVKLVISVLKDKDKKKEDNEKGNTLYTKLNHEFFKKDKGNVLKVDSLSQDEAEELMNTFLESRGRTVTQEQKTKVFRALEQCRLPLFLRLTFEEITRWPSYLPPEKTALETTLDSAITALYRRLETLHSTELVSTALGLLTVARRGLTEAELEDILSMDDKLLDRLYTFHTPPVRRLPPLLLVRLRDDLKQYIVSMEVDEVLVLQWNHKRFKEVARELYCSDRLEQLHRAIADFFTDELSDKAEEKRKRLVEEQALERGGKYNIRKLSNLPWALTGAGEVDALKKECLCNFSFLLGKIKALGFRSLLEDFAEAITRFPEDKDIEAVQGALQLSQRAVHNDLRVLPSQLIERLGPYTKRQAVKGKKRGKEECEEKTAVERLLEQCWRAPFPFLAADKAIMETPGGALTFTLPAHSSDVIGLQITPDGKAAVTCDKDGNLRVWDLTKRGLMYPEVKHTGGTPSHLFLSTCGPLRGKEPRRALVRDETAVTVYKLDTGRQDESLQFADYELDNPAVTVAGLENTYIICLQGSKAVRANVGKCKGKESNLPRMDSGAIGAKSLIAGSEQLVAVTDEQRYFLRVLSSSSLKDVNRGQACKRVFPAYDVPDNTEKRGPILTALCFHPKEPEILVAASHSTSIFFFETQMLVQKRVVTCYTEDPPRSLAIAYTGGVSDKNQDCYAYFPSQKSVTAVSLTGKKDATMTSHPCEVVHAATANMETMVTAGSDHVTKVWNIKEATQSREAWGETEQAQSKDVKTKDGRGMIRSLYLCPGTPRYVVAHKVSPSREQWLLVHDLETGQVVREAKILQSQEGYLELEVLPSGSGELKAILKIQEATSDTGRLAMIDLDKMKMVRRFPGQIHSERFSKERTFRVLNKHGLIVHMNDSAEKFCLRNYESRKVKKRLSVKGTIVSFQVNVQETILAAAVKEEEVVVFSLPKGSRQRRITIDDTMVEDADCLSLEAISGDGRRLMLDVEGVLRIWDTTKTAMASGHSSKVKGGLADIQPEEDEDEEEDIGDELNSVVALDDVTIACGYMNGVVQVYNLDTGKRLVREKCHMGAVEVMSQPWNRTYFLSFGLEIGDQKLVLWRKPESGPVQRLATYLPDYQLDAVQLGGGEEGGLVVGAVRAPVRVTSWRVAGQGYGKPQKPQPEIFPDANLTMKLDLHDDNISDPEDSPHLSSSEDEL